MMVLRWAFMQRVGIPGVEEVSRVGVGITTGFTRIVGPGESEIG